MSFRTELDANDALVNDIFERRRKIVRGERRSDVLARDIAGVEEKIEAATKDGDVELLSALLPRLDALQRIHAFARANDPSPTADATNALDAESSSAHHARRKIIDRINLVKRRRDNLRPTIAEHEKAIRDFGPTRSRLERREFLQAELKKLNDALEGVEALAPSDF
ncbi:MAG: hypothetical protein WCD76_21315 [Pyrinomonadaceae bacterium]